MNLSTVLNETVSYQLTAYSPISKEITLAAVLLEIKQEKYKPLVDKLRNYLAIDENDHYKNEKKNLPGVTFSASFQEKRRKEQLKKYNRIIVIDIDKLGQEQLAIVKQQLIQDDYVFSFWESPSKSGLKGLVYLQYKNEIPEGHTDVCHRNAFNQLTGYFFTTYHLKLDESGGDTTRLCFLSCDKELVLKDRIVPFAVDETEGIATDSIKTTPGIKACRTSVSQEFYNATSEKNDPGNIWLMNSIIRYLERNNQSITSSHDEWYRVAYAIADTFTYDIGEDYFLSLSKQDGVNYDETASKKTLAYCYNNNHGAITFRTLVHYAKKKGFKPIILRLNVQLLPNKLV